MYQFTFAPDPTLPEVRAARRAEARALLQQDAPELAHVELTADDEIALRPGAVVSYFPPGAWSERFATVECLRGDGQLLLRFAFSGLRWVWEGDCRLVLADGVAEGEEG